MERADVRVFYTVRELAMLLGVSQKRARRFFKSRGVLTQGIGASVVYLSALEEREPQMFASLALAEALRC